MKKTKKKTKAVKLVSVYTDEETRQRLRVYCATHGISMAEATTRAINGLLNARPTVRVSRIEDNHA